MFGKFFKIELLKKIISIPPNLKKYNLEINNLKNILIYKYDIKKEKTGIKGLSIPILQEAFNWDENFKKKNV